MNKTGLSGKRLNSDGKWLLKTLAAPSQAPTFGVKFLWPLVSALDIANLKISLHVLLFSY
jgi:hypothetical protein